MANGHGKIPSFEEWKNLPDDQRDYYLYHALAVVVEVKEKQSNFPNQFAGKWVETKFAIPVISLTVVTVFLAVLALVVTNGS